MEKTIDKKQKYSVRNVLRGMGRAIYYARKQKEFLPLSLAIFALAAVDPILILLWSKFIDALINSAHSNFNFAGFSLPWYQLLLISYFILIILNSGFDRFANVKNFSLRETLRVTYLASLAHHVFKLPLSFHKSFKAGEFKEVSRRSAASLSDVISTDLLNIAPQFVSMIVVIIILGFANLTMLGIAIVGLLLYLTVNLYYTPQIVLLQKQERDLYRIAGGVYDDALTNARSVKDFSMEDNLHADLLKYWKDRAFPVAYKLRKILQTSGYIQQVIRISTRAIVVVLSVHFVLIGEFTIGTLILFSSYMNDIFGPFSELLSRWRSIQSSIGQVQEAEEVLALSPEKYTFTNTSGISEINGKVEFRDVTFTYDDSVPILSEISFTADAGKTIALVGESGVGKSSLIDLILAYYFPSKGQVLIDGISTQEIPLDTLRRSIAIVPQETSLFNESIRYNIRYGNPGASDLEVEEAAKKAHCYDFIQKLPQKWDQIVGERGIKLSGGQKQRIAIARAILRKPKILILDEPTSALDASSEKIITESFEDLMRGRTTFIVAHRLSTVRRADMILVFKNGKIEERGSHKELLEKNGEYRRLYDLQIGFHE